MMTDINVCCVCLVKDVKLYELAANDVENIYECITGIRVAGSHELYTCNYCGLMMKKLQSFRTKCLESHNYLKTATFHTKHMKYTPYKKTKTTTTDIIFNQNISHETVVLEKLELDSDEGGDEDGRSTIMFKSENIVNDDTESCMSSDSEKPAVDVLGKEIEMVILTKEQQEQDLLDKRESSNYVNSMHKCEKCYKGFMMESSFSNHMIRHDPVISGTFTCSICQLCWPNKQTLRKHILTNHSRHFLCKICGKMTRTINAAKEHLDFHRGLVYSCKACSVKFTVKTSYISHVRTHHPSNHCCDLCGDSFVSEMGLKIHKRKGHVDVADKTVADFTCPGCEVVFQNYGALEKHRDVTGLCCGRDKQSTCVKCGDNFTSMKTLHEHLKTHSSEPEYVASSQSAQAVERLYQCNVCSKAFRRRESLCRHRRVHTGEKPYRCTLCPKSFTQGNGLKTHVQTIHLKLPNPYLKKAKVN